MDEPVEELEMTPALRRQLWCDRIWDKCQDRCANCGGSAHLRVVMIVPEEAGGQLVDSNGVLLCRTCDMVRTAEQKRSEKNERRPVSLWVSRSFMDDIHEAADEGFGTSMSALVRHLVELFVADPGRYPDLALYQDEGSDAKLNLWLDAPTYPKFKEILGGRSLTVTEAVVALVLLWNEQRRGNE